jgi:hypothetical protein
MEYIVNPKKCLVVGMETFPEGKIIKEEVAKKLSIESLLNGGAISEYKKLEPAKVEDPKEPVKESVKQPEPAKESEKEIPKSKQRIFPNKDSDI